MGDRYIGVQMDKIPSLAAMKERPSFVTRNIDELTRQNEDRRRIISTTPGSQLVLLCVPQGDLAEREIDTRASIFVKVESGYGIVTINGESGYLLPGSAAMISPGDSYSIKAMTGFEISDLVGISFVRSPGPLKMYLVYVYNADATPSHQCVSRPLTSVPQRQLGASPLW